VYEANLMKNKCLAISLGRELNVNVFETVLSNLLESIVNESLSIESIIFDMSKTEFIKLGGLISFLSLCGAIKEKRLSSHIENTTVHLQFPNDSVMEYLHWMQFFRISSDCQFIENSESLCKKDDEYFEKWENTLNRYRNVYDPAKKKDHKAKYFPIHFIRPNLRSTDFDSTFKKFINDLVDVFQPVFEYNLKFPKEHMRKFFQSNKELFKNIFDHSGSWGLVAVQVMKNNVIFSYSDIGIGIRRSLNKFLQNKYRLDEIDDCLAIKEATKKGVSSKEQAEENMGLGLFIVSQYAKKAKGKMVIRSGKCHYSITSGGKQVNHFPGTQIHISIPTRK